MGCSRAINHTSPWKPEDRQPPWAGFEYVLFGPLGHEQGFDEYENGQDPGVVWTLSDESGEMESGGAVATTPTKGARPRPRMRPPPSAPAATGSAPEEEDDMSPLRKRQRTDGAIGTPALQTPGTSSNASGPSKSPRTPTTSPGAPRTLLGVVVPTSAGKRPQLVGPVPRR
ncbi:hypothetical protein FS749_016110 [Ceratobasidium sp. UAMH 11750]|nr:hypothetical protein FS749_016110 [Ceratobasidium sp. UAMH 11750]